MMIQLAFASQNRAQQFNLWSFDFTKRLPVNDQGFMLIPTAPTADDRIEFRNLDLLPFSFTYSIETCLIKNYFCPETNCLSDLAVSALTYLHIPLEKFAQSKDLLGYATSLYNFRAFVPRRWIRCPHCFHFS